MLVRNISLAKRPGNAPVQRTRQLLLGPLRTTLISVAACVWAFASESSHRGTIGRALLLFLPHVALLLLLGLHFFPRLQQRMHRWVVIATVALIPVVFVAIIHSGFHMGVGLCCCSRAFCPATPSAETTASGRVLDNCYMAFIRKIVHFYATASLLSPLTTIVFGELSRGTRQSLGQRHCHDFLVKSRSL